ncbi:MAG: PAS domain S-box protein [Candidatus Delongbacteria bacterium]
MNADGPNPTPTPFTDRQELLESLLMGHGDAICALDLDDRILFVNHAAAELLGGSVDDLVGRFQQEVFGDRVYAETQKQLDERLQGRSSTYELGMYDVQGRERTLLVTGNPLRNRQGGIVGSFGVLKDITERKAREQALETRLLLDQAVSDSVRALVRPGRFAEALGVALGGLGILLNADCVRVYLMDPARAELCCTQEWPPLRGERSVLGRPFPAERYPWWLLALRSGEILYVKEMDKLPVAAVKERETMEKLGIRSLLAIPLLQNDVLLGFVSLENPDPFGEVLSGDLGSLLVFGDVLAASLAQRETPAS